VDVWAHLEAHNLKGGALKARSPKHANTPRNADAFGGRPPKAELANLGQARSRLEDDLVERHVGEARLPEDLDAARDENRLERTSNILDLVNGGL
jgi:hypothetical protein